MAGPRKPLLIALTGYSQPTDKESARAAGFDHHLSKPLDLAQLQPLLSGAVSTARH
jgi:CheY-like chemotaxis protein